MNHSKNISHVFVLLSVLSQSFYCEFGLARLTPCPATKLVAADLMLLIHQHFSIISSVDVNLIEDSFSASLDLPILGEVLAIKYVGDFCKSLLLFSTDSK